MFYALKEIRTRSSFSWQLLHIGKNDVRTLAEDDKLLQGDHPVPVDVHGAEHLLHFPCPGPGRNVNAHQITDGVCHLQDSKLLANT